MFYETKENKKIEFELAKRYFIATGRIYDLKPQKFLSHFDFLVYYKGKPNHWLEVKKKSGFFEKTEIIPYSKWLFVLNSPIPCFFLVERDNKAILFNLTDIASGKSWIKRNVSLPKGRIYGEKAVVVFDTDLGRILYYIDIDNFKKI